MYVPLAAIVNGISIGAGVVLFCSAVASLSEPVMMMSLKPPLISSFSSDVARAGKSYLLGKASRTIFELLSAVPITDSGASSKFLYAASKLSQQHYFP